VNKNHVADAALLPEMFSLHLRPESRDDDFTPHPSMPLGSFYTGPIDLPPAEHVDDRSTTLALEWLTTRDREQPFFMWLNWDLPHPPYRAPRGFHGRTDRTRLPLPPRDDGAGKPLWQEGIRKAYGLDAMRDGDWVELISTYLDSCSFVDSLADRVLRGLRDLELEEDTIVVFWSDHGDFAGQHGLTEQWDTSFYDCVTRVPLAIRWPGRVAAQRSAALVESIDIMPTLLELAGVPLPPGTQGLSLVPLLDGTTDLHRADVLSEGGQEPALLARARRPDDRPLVAEAYRPKQVVLHANPLTNERAKMLRTPTDKYVFRATDTEEYYDLGRDPFELDNRIADPSVQARVSELRRRLLARLVAEEDTLPDQDFLEA
jgi:arylsulfatase